MRLLPWVLTTLWLAGCVFDSSGLATQDGAGPMIDAGVIDAIPVDVACDSSSYVNLCVSAPAGDRLDVSGAQVLDTDTDPRCRSFAQTGGPEACLIYVTGVSIAAGASLTANGKRPLILAATGDVTIDGLLDVGSRRGGTSGAGADFAGCPPPARVAENDLGGAGGAAGGSFGGRGGEGGNGDTDDTLGLDGDGKSGLAGPPQGLPPFVRGGCPGSDGADESGGGKQGGARGAGGGAVYVLAQQSVVVTSSGVIRATGAGAGGGESQAGGGGGGAGGFIGIEATTIVVAGQLSANGGGGGGGGGRINGVDIAGGVGADGKVGNAPAAGGNASHEPGGTGGNGSAGVLGATDGKPDLVGGGGGGGGAGFVHLTGQVTLSGVSSPAPTP